VWRFLVLVVVFSFSFFSSSVLHESDNTSLPSSSPPSCRSGDLFRPHPLTTNIGIDRKNKWNGSFRCLITSSPRAQGPLICVLASQEADGIICQRTIQLTSLEGRTELALVVHNGKTLPESQELTFLHKKHHRRTKALELC